jgi:hypothetical protein
VFAQVDEWFERPEDLRQYRPGSGGWSIGQVLEHITLTIRFLMLTLRKWVGIAERRVRRGEPIPPRESDLTRLAAIGLRGSFGWDCPEHMQPTAVPPADEVRATFHRQLGECLILLERMSDGSGALCQITMRVNDLGKIDLYQWLYFLAQHARRHVQQMEAIEAEYRAKTLLHE